MGVEEKDSSHSHTVVENVMEKPLTYDSESGSAAVHGNEGTLKRQLKNRHIAMIRYALHFVSTFPRQAHKLIAVRDF